MVHSTLSGAFDEAIAAVSYPFQVIIRTRITVRRLHFDTIIRGFHHRSALALGISMVPPTRTLAPPAFDVLEPASTILGRVFALQRIIYTYHTTWVVLRRNP